MKTLIVLFINFRKSERFVPSVGISITESILFDRLKSYDFFDIKLHLVHKDDNNITDIEEKFIDTFNTVFYKDYDTVILNIERFNFFINLEFIIRLKKVFPHINIISFSPYIDYKIEQYLVSKKLINLFFRKSLEKGFSELFNKSYSEILTVNKFSFIEKFKNIFRSYPLETSRGCSWRKCTFCTSQKNYPLKIKSIEEIEKEILELSKRRIYDTIDIIDNDPFITKKRLYEIVSLFKKYDFKFIMSTRIEKLNSQIIDRLLTNNMCGLFLGIESLDEDKLLKIKKTTNPKYFINKVYEITSYFKEIGIEKIVELSLIKDFNSKEQIQLFEKEFKNFRLELNDYYDLTNPLEFFEKDYSQWFYSKHIKQIIKLVKNN